MMARLVSAKQCILLLGRVRLVSAKQRVLLGSVWYKAVCVAKQCTYAHARVCVCVCVCVCAVGQRAMSSARPQ